MTANLTKKDWLHIYAKLQRAAGQVFLNIYASSYLVSILQFPQYNYRQFAKRRIRDYFEANRTVSDPNKLNELHKVGFCLFIICIGI